MAPIQSKPGTGRIRIPSPTLGLSWLFLAVIATCAIGGRWLRPKDPYVQDLLNTAAAPSRTHLLGTDDLGRDVFSRLVVGTAHTLAPPLCVAIGAAVLGSALGLWASYRGGLVDSLSTFVSDIVYSMPFLLIAIVVVGVIGTNDSLTVALLILLLCPANFRLVRSATAGQVRLPYVDAARTLGVSDLKVMVRHVVPNVAPTIVANVLLNLVTAILALSSLAFLGVGGQIGGTDWGTILASGQPLIGENSMMAIAPAALIALTCTSCTILADHTYDQLSVNERH